MSDTLIETPKELIGIPVELGDSIYISQLKETWIVGWISRYFSLMPGNAKNERYGCLGWPFSLIEQSKCALVKKCTWDQRMKLIHKCESMMGVDDLRQRYAQDILDHYSFYFKWTAIEYYREDMGTVMRPHIIHGPMAVKPAPKEFTPSRKEPWKCKTWFSESGATAWPDTAFLPLWMPRPVMPPVPDDLRAKPIPYV